jgi:hypothetical protein
MGRVLVSRSLIIESTRPFLGSYRRRKYISAA